ncbi:MAG TPA: DoxX family protein [Pirellulales bacterium]|nr:DoxX family protein [Pirellulales bacterium]
MDSTSSCWSQNIGKLLLRLTIGGLLLCHGIAKIRNGIDWMGPQLAAHNLPDFVRYGVYIGEVLAPVLVIIGLFTRIGGLIIAINMGVAVWLAHANELWQMDPMGGWARELDALYLLGALCIMFLGAGSFSIDGLLSKRTASEAPAESKSR